MKGEKRWCKLNILKMKSYIFQLILGFRDSNSENNNLLEILLSNILENLKVTS